MSGDLLELRDSENRVPGNDSPVQGRLGRLCDRLALQQDRQYGRQEPPYHRSCTPPNSR